MKISAFVPCESNTYITIFCTYLKARLPSQKYVKVLERTPPGQQEMMRIPVACKPWIPLINKMLKAESGIIPNWLKMPMKSPIGFFTWCNTCKKRIDIMHSRFKGDISSVKFLLSDLNADFVKRIGDLSYNHVCVTDSYVIH